MVVYMVRYIIKFVNGFPCRGSVKHVSVLMGTLLGTIVIVLVAWTEFCYKFGVQ